MSSGIQLSEAITRLSLPFDQFHSFIVSEQFAGVGKIEKVARHGLI
jgi:hypothetical protein